MAANRATTQAIRICEETAEGLRVMKTFTSTPKDPNNPGQFDDEQLSRLIQFLSGMPTQEEPGTTPDGEVASLPANNAEKEKWQLALKEGFYGVFLGGSDTPATVGAAYQAYLDKQQAPAESTPAPAAAAAPAVDSAALEQRRQLQARADEIGEQLDIKLSRVSAINSNIAQLEEERSSLQEEISSLTTEASDIKEQLKQSEAQVEQAQQLITQSMVALMAQMEELKRQAQALGLNL